MKGLIMVYNDQKQAGGIATPTGQRYIFQLADWQEELTLPECGMMVEFEVDEGGRAHHVRLALPEPSGQSAQDLQEELTPDMPTLAPVKERYVPSPKKKSVLTLLGIFLGVYGGHKFYLGAWGWGLAYIFGGIFLSMLMFVHPVMLIFPLALYVFVGAEWIRYILMTDAQFEQKMKRYQAKRPSPFAFFW
ncbi:TM2 domain-containing protein [Lampropedia aestuarii]|uniref:TM2 domain-containing protein n=1 Tax=Lampropedia aestuarii TaxID=2562762 RepID=UPI002469A216|nr:TM2 domain-containing protein [Lampropedia aestuarii]MDH5859187.1 TM2 domain-containing protein [Lampropedia aestuarii]